MLCVDNRQLGTPRRETSEWVQERDIQCGMSDSQLVLTERSPCVSGVCMREEEEPIQILDWIQFSCSCHLTYQSCRRGSPPSHNSHFGNKETMDSKKKNNGCYVSKTYSIIEVMTSVFYTINRGLENKILKLDSIVFVSQRNINNSLIILKR